MPTPVRIRRGQCSRAMRKPPVISSPGTTRGTTTAKRSASTFSGASASAVVRMNTADVPQMSMVKSKAITACERCSLIRPLLPNHQCAVNAAARCAGS